MKLITFVLILISSISLVFSFSYQGQLLFNIDDSYSYQTSYISTVLYSKSYDNNQSHLFDFKWSREFLKNSDSRLKNSDYRLWIKYSFSDFMNIRLGMQKISFGVSSILRPLNWFDTIDFRNNSGQTIGVNALKTHIFPSDNLELCFWAIDDDKISYGSRIELLNDNGSVSITYYNDRDDSNHEVFQSIHIIEEQPQLLFPGTNHRIGIDYRYDGNMGAWFESSSILSSIKNININRIDMITFGCDYTIPIFDGLYLLSETMHSSIVHDDNLALNQTATAIMGNIPIGIFNEIMLVSILNWDQSDKYHFLRWSTSFDYFYFNIMASVNPKPLQNNFEIMLIYNY